MPQTFFYMLRDTWDTAKEIISCLVTAVVSLSGSWFKSPHEVLHSMLLHPTVSDSDYERCDLHKRELNLKFSHAQGLGKRLCTLNSDCCFLPEDSVGLKPAKSWCAQLWWLARAPWKSKCINKFVRLHCWVPVSARICLQGWGSDTWSLLCPWIGGVQWERELVDLIVGYHSSAVPLLELAEII